MPAARPTPLQGRFRYGAAWRRPAELDSSITLTVDAYTSVLPQLAATAAEKTAPRVPPANR